MLDIKRKNVKTLLILTIVLSITISTIQISAVENIEEEKSYPIEKIIGCKATRTISKMDNQKLVKKEVIQELPKISTLANTPILSSDIDCQHPAITSEGNSILVVGEHIEGSLSSDLVMTYSSDSGNTWSDLSGFQTEAFESNPCIDY